MILLVLFLYMSLYTWNWHTKILDRFVTTAGMEFVGWVLEPGIWLQNKATSLWDRYIDLVGVQKQNKKLKHKIRHAKLKIFKLKRKTAQLQRLEKLLKFSPPKDWSYQGARVLAHEIGPNAVLESLLLNKGSTNGIDKYTPVVTPEGLVGEVLRSSPHYSNILLLSDPNCHVPVKGRKSRTNGIIKGQGPTSLLKLAYVPKHAELYKNEILVTSGLGRIFPKGIPVAQIVQIKESSLSLFKKVKAKTLVNLKRLEEVLLLEISHKNHAPEDSEILKKYRKEFAGK